MHSKTLSLICILAFTLSNTSYSQYTTNSLLSSGDIYKISVSQSGVHKIDKSVVDGLGISATEAASLGVYGHAGGTLPQSNADPKTVDDLEQLHIYTSGLDDGSWDQNDYILYYAESANTWKVDPTEGSYYATNPYTAQSYYYLKATPQRLEIPLMANVTPEVTYDEYTRYQRFEENKLNLLDGGSHQGSGREWYGDIFNNTRARVYTQQFDWTDVKSGTPIDLKLNGATRSENTSIVTLSVNGTPQSRTMGTLSLSNNNADYALKTNVNVEAVAQSNNAIEISYPHNGDTESTFWLNYLEMKTSNTINYQSSPLVLTSEGMDAYQSIGFEIKADNPLTIWDVSEHYHSRELPTQSSNGTVSFNSANAGENRRYVAFDQNTISLKPEVIGKVENQNLHQIQRADMIIVYADKFAEQAERLAEHRRSHNEFAVVTVDVSEIWEEYSAGKVDPSAIRNFFKMVYERDPAFRYAILMGDGSFDYQNIRNLPNPGNYIPVYETVESLDPILSYPTDDYYGLLDSDEGQEDNQILKGDLDIALGRFPVNTTAEAAGMVDKIIAYETSPDRFGPWRTEVLFAADDGNGTLHVSDSNGIANEVQAAAPYLHQNKVFFDAYKQISTPGGERYPEASEAIRNGVQRGQLVTCYLGHGGPKGWAQERVLQVDDIQSWDNKDNMTVMITATCSFAGYDDPGLISAGEHAILNPNGGVVALLTTVRSVYTSSNRALTSLTWKNLFDNLVSDRTIGEALNLSKNAEGPDSRLENSRKYIILGDPALQLAKPRYEVIPTALNGIDLDDTAVDTLLSALETGTLSGIIAKDQQHLTDFNGEVFVTLYDKVSSIKTLVNDDESNPYTFEARNTLLFKGKAEVINGEFDIDFVLPKNIKFDIGEGLFYFYAVDYSDEKDAAGQHVHDIGGSLEDDLSDNEGPIIELYMNDTNFKDGGITNSEPVLLALLSDDNGINLSNTSIGHDLKATLDEDDSQSYIVNDFYISNLDDYKSGEVRYPLSDLELGLHTVEFIAWDILNNSSIAELSFVVSDGNLETLVDVINYPNPSSERTYFSFEHTGTVGDQQITINIYDSSGKNIENLQYIRPSSGFREVDIEWSHGERNIPPGIYFYRIVSLDQETKTTQTSDLQKLLISN